MDIQVPNPFHPTNNPPRNKKEGATVIAPSKYSVSTFS